MRHYPSRSALAALMAVLTLVALGIGFAIGKSAGEVNGAAPTSLLLVAEALKLISAATGFAIAWRSRETPRGLRAAGLVGNLLIAAAGVVGTIAILRANPPLGALVTPLALAGLTLVAVWLVAMGRGLSARMLTGLAAALALASVVAQTLPSIGLLCGLIAFVCWVLLSRRIVD